MATDPATTHGSDANGAGWRRSIFGVANRGLGMVGVAVILLFALGALVAPSSVSRGAILGMLPFAAVLAVVGLGQTLVIQQGGIDLSVPGAISLTVVVCTWQAQGDDGRLLGAVVTALGLLLVAGIINGFLVVLRGLNPIIATLGTNALLYAVVLGRSGGIPRSTTALLARITGHITLGIPNVVYFAVAAVVIVTIVTKKSVAGRRFEGGGGSPRAAWAAGLRAHTHGMGAYIWAMVLYWLAG